jgi:transcriptional regulator with XRE-family HTH domain
MANLHQLLKKHRQSASLTQKALGARLACDHSVISRLENEDSVYLPSDDFIDNFIQTLQLSEEESLELHQALIDARRTERRPAFMEPRLTNNPSGEKPSIPIKEQSLHSPKSLFTPIQIKRRTIIGALLAGLLILISLSSIFWQQASGQTHPTASQSTATQLMPALEITPIPTTSAEQVLYSQDFQNERADEWIALNTGQWEIIRQKGNVVFGVQNQDPDAIPNAFLRDSEAFSDYSFQTDVIFKRGRYEQIYMVVRNQGRVHNCTGYRIGGNRLGVSIFRFDPKTSCQGELLAENLKFPLVPGRWYTMRIDVHGSDIRYYIDNELVLEANDSKYPTGGIGLLAYEVEWAYFDNILVKKLDKLE